MADTVDVLKDKLSSLNQVGKEGYKDPSLDIDIDEFAAEILNIVGHSRENIFLDLNLEVSERIKGELGNPVFSKQYIHFSAVAARTAASPPQVAITTTASRRIIPRNTKEPIKIEDAGKYVLACDVTSKAEYTVLLTNDAIAILGQEYPPKAYPLAHLSDENVREIADILSPPEEYPQGRGGKFPAGYHPNQTKLTRWLFGDSNLTPDYQSEINKQFFKLDIQEYSQILYNAYSAQNNQEKGKLLEDVAAHLFENLSLVSIRDRNLRTKSGEIDLVLEYIGGESPNLFEYQTRFTLVECKNVGSSVSSKEIGHFDKKLNEAESSLGILIAWNGISGQESGKDAQRYVDNAENDIVVLTANELYQILDGKSLYEIIDEIVYSIRFDL